MDGPCVELRHHLIISGTGRAGTTFLVQLLTVLGLETGYSDPWQARDESAHAGMEWDLRLPWAPYVVKDPALCDTLGDILRECPIIIDHALVPIRDLREAAASRAAVHAAAGASAVPDVTPGGLVGTSDPSEQEALLAKRLARLLMTLSRHDIPSTVLEFPRFVLEPEYLYAHLRPLLPASVDYGWFRQAHGLVARPGLIHVFTEAGKR